MSIIHITFDFLIYQDELEKFYNILVPLFILKDIEENTGKIILKVEIEQKKDNMNLEKIKEPENFYVYSDSTEDLILNSKDFSTLLKKLQNVKFDKKLAEFYSKYENDIEDERED